MSEKIVITFLTFACNKNFLHKPPLDRVFLWDEIKVLFTLHDNCISSDTFVEGNPGVGVAHERNTVVLSTLLSSEICGLVCTFLKKWNILGQLNQLDWFLYSEFKYVKELMLHFAISTLRGRTLGYSLSMIYFECKIKYRHSFHNYTFRQFNCSLWLINWVIKMKLNS